ncbi:esterase, partial [Burkholderia pseudomallei]
MRRKKSIIWLPYFDLLSLTLRSRPRQKVAKPKPSVTSPTSAAKTRSTKLTRAEHAGRTSADNARGT